MGRKKKYPILEDVTIVDVAAGGNSIARVNNQVVFVPGLVPGDIVDVQIVRKRKKFLEGVPVRFKKESTIRVVPFCSHFGTCGGCKWQNMPYQKQLFYKQKQVTDNLERIAKVDIAGLSPIIGSEKQQFYRNKLEYTFSEKKWLTNEEVAQGDDIADRRALGFHIPGKFDRILNIETCYLQDDLSNQIRLAIWHYTIENGYSFYNQRTNEGLMRNLIIRNTLFGEWMVIVVFQFDHLKEIKSLMEFIKSSFPWLTSLMHIINPKANDTTHDLDVILYSGRDHIFESIDGLKFKIGPKSFFQTNTAQAIQLYKKTLEFASLTGSETVYDLYTGTGTIANYIASQSKLVVGIEYVSEAIDDANINSAINNINNTRFFSGDIRSLLNEEFFTQHGMPDVIITDPPRAGMHPDVVDSMLYAAPARIVYVSCNPATQARDINILLEKYKVTAIQPVDMFPHTHHVENIVRLDRL